MRKGLIIGALVVQVVVVAAMVWIAMEPLRSGRPVTVTVTGVDPRDLMRGQYVEFDYPFSTLDLGAVKGDLDRYRTYQYGDVVYVSLTSDTDPKVRWISMEQPEDGALFLKGRVARRASGEPLATLDINYGIESYYTNPDRAEELDEHLQGTGKVRVYLKVDDDGDARIEHIEVVE